MTIANGVIAMDGYKGEAYFLDHANKVDRIEWGTNEAVIHQRQDLPGTLVLNQNFDKEWKSDHGEVFNYQGLIGVKLDGGTGSTIRITYSPKSFVLGFIISIASLLMLLIVSLVKKQLLLKKIISP